MPTLIPLDERNATRATAQAAIDSSLSVETAKAAKLLSEGRAAASRGSAALQAEASTADAEARVACVTAFRLQATPLAAELLKHENLECLRDYRAKYRRLQAHAVTYTGQALPLMPLLSLGQILISHTPEVKPRIARLATISEPNPGHCAGKEIAAVHNALMSRDLDDRSVREAVFDLDRKLTQIARFAAPGSFADEIWEFVKAGLGFYEMGERVRALSAAEARKAAGEAAPVPAIVKMYNGAKMVWGEWLGNPSQFEA
jgi:hypothetical protein